MDDRAMARGLGWFSIGLGLAELAAPKQLGAYLGMEDRAGLIRAYGLREIASGVAILAMPDPAPGVWARVGGDGLDLATLRAGLADDNPKRDRVKVATAAVAAITVVDVACAQHLSGGAAGEGAAADEPEVQRTITIGRPSDELYRLWREPETLSRVLGHVGDVTATSDTVARWAVSGPLGKTLEWETRIVEERPGESLRWESLPGAPVSNQGEIAFRPAPGEWGTEVSLRVRFEPAGPLGRAALMLDGMAPKLLASQALRRFKSLAETGEIPTLNRQPAARGDGRDA